MVADLFQKHNGVSGSYSQDKKHVRFTMVTSGFKNMTFTIKVSYRLAFQPMNFKPGSKPEPAFLTEHWSAWKPISPQTDLDAAIVLHKLFAAHNDGLISYGNVDDMLDEEPLLFGSAAHNEVTLFFC